MPISDVSSNEEHISLGIRRDIKRARVDTYVNNDQSLIARGGPQGLMNLPLETFMEVSGKDMAYSLPKTSLLQIASWVGLRDLLFLARTCKSLRSVLMRRSAEGVWRAAEAGVPGLPKCRNNVDLPVYAALVFTNLCTVRAKIIEMFSDTDT